MIDAQFITDYASYEELSNPISIGSIGCTDADFTNGLNLAARVG